jgi:flagellar L-ring protein precursor FlgH
MTLRYLLPLCLVAAPLAAQAPAGAPAGAPGNAPSAAAADPAARTVRQSWTSPRRSFAVGDVITVLVDEYTLASANTGTSATDTRRRELGLDGGFDMAESGMSARADVRTSNGAQSTQRGEAVRQNRFQSEMSVRIVGVDSTTGLLKLEGSKLVDVDKNRQEVTFSGFARPQDISAQNMVESWRVADAQLVYAAKGSLGKPKGSILGKVLGILWP